MCFPLLGYCDVIGLSCSLCLSALSCPALWLDVLMDEWRVILRVLLIFVELVDIYVWILSSIPQLIRHSHRNPPPPRNPNIDIQWERKGHEQTE